MDIEKLENENEQSNTSNEESSIKTLLLVRKALFKVTK